MRGQQRRRRAGRSRAHPQQLCGRAVRVARENESRQKETECILQGRVGEVEPVDLEKFAVVEAVTEQTATAQRE